MNCKSKTTSFYARDNRSRWFIRRNKLGKELGYLCAKCYDKLRRSHKIACDFKDRLNNRICSNCGEKTLTTITRKGYPHQRWYKDDKTGFWCNSCYHKITDDPKRITETNLRRMKFKDKVIHLAKNPRTGICSLCGNKVRQEIRKTSMHHIQYHDDDPLKDTIEICPRCHIKQSMKKYNVGSLRWKTPVREG